ncbi:hypothetical protein [Bacillus wiedmannii]|uniref:Hypothetical Cytosolic Protein n=1 Tax=Bacillus wiedmannii TaxID=1890302 RepID=A0A1C4B4Q7_9BACI|nr:hypothetical protein [Bacillus wiedmannii]SCC01819.1 Hypothetical Cytosolic Protein [Bacillus wiedmannii]
MNFDEQIATYKQQKQQLLDEMEGKKEMFLDELVKFTASWFEEHTMHSIKNNPEKVIGLGEDKARQLKTELKELANRSDELVKSYMSEDALWWHMNENKHSYFAYDYKLQEKHEKKIKLMFGELGKILIAYDIEKASSEYQRDFSSSWFYDGYSSKENKNIRYASGVTFSKELHTSDKEYIELIKKVQDINWKIEDLEEQKKVENVEDWWTSL